MSVDDAHFGQSPTITYGEVKDQSGQLISDNQWISIDENASDMSSHGASSARMA